MGGLSGGRSRPSCVGRSEKTSRICYEIPTGGENIDLLVGEVAFFHGRPLRSRPVSLPIVEWRSVNRDGGEASSHKMRCWGEQTWGRTQSDPDGLRCWQA